MRVLNSFGNIPFWKEEFAKQNHKFTTAHELLRILSDKLVFLCLADERSLPHPRGLWPLTSEYHLTEITGRSPCIQPTDTNNTANFSISGPYGNSNGRYIYTQSITHYIQTYEFIKSRYFSVFLFSTLPF